MDDRPVPSDRPDNLFEPVDHDFGTHGHFASRSRTWSAQLWATKNRRTVAAAVGGAALLTANGVLRRRLSEDRYDD